MAKIIDKGEFTFENIEYQALSVADIKATK